MIFLYVTYNTVFPFRCSGLPGNPDHPYPHIIRITERLLYSQNMSTVIRANKCKLLSLVFGCSRCTYCNANKYVTRSLERHHTVYFDHSYLLEVQHVIWTSMLVDKMKDRTHCAICRGESQLFVSTQDCKQNVRYHVRQIRSWESL